MSYKDGQRLIVKRIKSPKDLPEKNGNYFAHSKSGRNISIHYWKSEGQYGIDVWMRTVDWYLIPEEITDSDIEAWAETFQLYSPIEQSLLMAGAKQMRDNEIKHIQNEE
jgi:hypothetical protein